MTIAKPKKKKEPNVQAIVPQGAGKRPEAQVRNPATGGSEFKRLEESGLSRAEVQQIVTPNLLQNSNEFQDQPQAEQPEQPTPEELIQAGIIQPNAENSGIQMGGVNIPLNTQNIQTPMGVQSLDRALDPNINAIDLTPEERQARVQAFNQANPDFNKLTPKNIVETAFLAAGASGVLEAAGSYIAAKLAAKAALNTAPAAVKYASKFAPAVDKNLIGSVPEAGKLAANLATKGLISRIISSAWTKVGLGVTSLGIISNILDDGFKGTKYTTMIGDIEQEIAENNKLIENEQIEIVKDALNQENARLVQLLDEVTNPKGWEGIVKKSGIPIIDSPAAKNVVADARLKFDESKHVRKAEILLQKQRFIASAPPKIQEYLIELAKKRKQFEGV